MRTEPVCTDDGDCGSYDDISKNREINRIERWCDNFAGAFLIPETKIRDNKKIIRLINDGKYLEAADVVAKETTVIKAAALTRLAVCGLVSFNTVSDDIAKLSGSTHKAKTQIHADINEDDEESDVKMDKKKKGGPDKALLTLAEVGDSYVKLANRNLDNGHISYASYLNKIGITKNSHERLKNKGVIE